MARLDGVELWAILEDAADLAPVVAVDHVPDRMHAVLDGLARALADEDDLVRRALNRHAELHLRTLPRLEDDEVWGVAV